MPRKKRSTVNPEELSDKGLKDIQKIHEQMQIQNRVADLNRTRSVVVGNAGGGTTEVGLRASDGRYLYSLLQPVEAIELIHQLAANVGCHLHLVPRQDFSSWREWKVSPEELAHYRGQQHLPGVGHPPHLSFQSDLNKQNLQHQMPEPSEQPGVEARNELKDESEKENVVGIEKVVNK